MTADLTFRTDDLVRLRADEPALHVIDVRTTGEFARRHIPGSYNVPLPDLAEHRAELSATGTSVVLVCESGHRAGLAERQLRETGFDAVHVLEGGVKTWEAQGLPLERSHAATAPWTLERQVRFVAGAIVASAVAVSVVWPPARFAAGAVGFGLVVAAVTDTCAMGLALARLPYNRRGPGCDLPTIASTLTNAEEVRS